jgi:hypothetical protein
MMCSAAPGASTTTSQCLRLAGVARNVFEAAQAVNNTLVGLVFTGYCMPSRPTDRCTQPQQVFEMNQRLVADAQQQLPPQHRERVTFADVTTACGGSNDSWSPSTTHYDSIHVNARGYCNVFTQPAVQRAFACPADDPIDVDCAALDPRSVPDPEMIPQPRWLAPPSCVLTEEQRFMQCTSARASGHGRRAARSQLQRSSCANERV